MIGWSSQHESEGSMNVRLMGFDDYEVRLGDRIRGKRAAMGKSIQDVQRELRINADYIAAIEDTNPEAFEVASFIPGFVRSYARYLDMDADDCLASFCAESGFEILNGLMAETSDASDSPVAESELEPTEHDLFFSPKTPYIPSKETLVSQIEPRAIASSLVLLVVICGLGYGGWGMLNKIQQVQVSPVERAPVVLSDLDPLDEARVRFETAGISDTAAPASGALDRLYRPQALDVPVLVARDASIASLDPGSVGTFRPPEPPKVEVVEATEIHTEEQERPALPQVVEQVDTALKVVAVAPSWMRIRAADGSVLFEGVLGTVEQGNTFEIPLTEEPPQLRAGASGVVYVLMNGEHYGPVGASGTVTKDVVLSEDRIAERYEVADLEAEQNSELKQFETELQTQITEIPAE